jgi:CRP-like cAMP-binding protein
MSKMNPSDSSIVTARTGWLSATPTTFQSAVLAKADGLSFRKGAPIVQQGDEAGGLLGVLEGQIELHLQSTDGKGRTLALIAGQGFWFGDLTSILGRPRRIGPVPATSTSLKVMVRAWRAMRDPILISWAFRSLSIALLTSIVSTVADGAPVAPDDQRTGVTSPARTT